MLGKQIRRIRLARGMTLLDLAQVTGRDVGNLSRLETGKQGYTSETLTLIADALGVQVADLFGSAENFRPPTALGHVPVLSWAVVTTMTDRDSIRVAREQSDETAELRHERPSQSMFAVRVTGDAMASPTGDAPSFPAGTLVIFNAERRPAHGDFVIARDARTKQASFKKLVEDGGRWFLMALDPRYPVTEIDGDLSGWVIAVAVEWQISGTL